MKIIVNNNEQQIDARNITVVMDDIEFKISENQFGELVVQKHNFGDGKGALIIKPSVSNEIRII